MNKKLVALIALSISLSQCITDEFEPLEPNPYASYPDKSPIFLKRAFNDDPSSKRLVMIFAFDSTFYLHPANVCCFQFYIGNEKTFFPRPAAGLSEVRFVDLNASRSGKNYGIEVIDEEGYTVGSRLNFVAKI